MTVFLSARKTFCLKATFENKGVESVIRPYLGFSVGGYSGSIEKRIIGSKNNTEITFGKKGMINKQLVDTFLSLSMYQIQVCLLAEGKNIIEVTI